MVVGSLLLSIHIYSIIVSSESNVGYSILLKTAAENSGALCLDGSPGNYYINNNGTNIEKNKFVMFMQGGGWCSGLYKSDAKQMNSCWDRRNTSTGSTKSDSKTLNLNNYECLENNKSTNPLLYNWTKIYVRYCDGASYSGDLTKPIINENNPSELLYFRGKRILDAIFEDLIKNYNLLQATDFVFGGGSAGGEAVYLHSNYIADKYFNLTKTKFVSLPDIGFFINYNGYPPNSITNFSNGMKWVFDNQNISSSILSPLCFDDEYPQINNCIFAQNIAGNITIPIFVLNSQYDQWQAQNILGTGSSNATLLNEYGKNFTKILINNVLSHNKYNGNIYGAFIDACYHHDSAAVKYWSNMYIDGYTQSYAFQEFYYGLDKPNGPTRTFWYDNDTFPCNSCCPQ
eukprot:14340_1